ncbi:hypothetical protein GLP14_18355 [Photobacterium carnosum]|uniref:hypothetical protein n=1 Tax=Photobacterium carnosum TaxID=2023717 RepID=UPI001E5CB8A5|nr:hypothetical protein [Photobacterium carnosum]MCD9524766.1 hypothetical protein [Photobacterium carnosum]
MEFRYPSAVAETNAEALRYLTENLSDEKSGREAFERILEKLGHSIETYPDWHPILTIPKDKNQGQEVSLKNLSTYKGNDHNVYFVKGFVTCPYSEDEANQLVSNVNAMTGLHAYRLKTALYDDSAYPVVVQAIGIELEADGTIRSRDAITWCSMNLVKAAHNANVAETWWNLRGALLGYPHGSRSSIFVNQHTGSHIRKILETLNNSGMFGPIYEWSLDMLSKRKRDKITETLIMAAINNYSKVNQEFEFELRGELCVAEVRNSSDTQEFFVKVKIGKDDLCVDGYYYPPKDHLIASAPKGKRSVAEKFL